MAGEFGGLLDLDFSAPSAVSDGASFAPSGNYSLGVSDFAPEALKLASEASGGASGATPAAGGGFWSRLFASGGDVLKGAGDIAKSALPLASLGTGIMGAINSRDLMGQIAKQTPITQAAEKQQLTNAQQGAALAPQAAAIGPKIEALAPAFGDLSKSVAAEAPKFGALAKNVETNVAGPQVDYGKKLLAMADAGTLLDADKAKLDEWEQRQVADVQAYFARSGQGDSTAVLDKIGEIKQQRAAAESQILAGYRDQAASYLNAGGNALVSGAGGLTQQELAAMVQSGQMTAEEAAILQASVAPLSAAGGILAGSAGAASSAAASSKAEEQSLEQLIATLQQQLGITNGRAAA